MRRNSWALGIVIGLAAAATAAPATAQQREASSFLTGVQPQDIVFQKVIDVPEFASPQSQRQTTDRFSFRQILAKVFPFISPSVTPSLQMAVPAFPGSAQASPLQPMLPQFSLPGIRSSPLLPALPRTSLPSVPDNSTLRPVLPIP